MVLKDEITVAVDELQKGVRVLIDLPSRVTINTEEYRRFYDKVQSFVGRYNLDSTEEWEDVDRWLIRRPNEYLTLEEAGHLKLALEKLRIRALMVTGEKLTAEERTLAEKRIEESFKELNQFGQEQVRLLKEQIEILKIGNKSARMWNWIMFRIAIVGVVIAMVK